MPEKHRSRFVLRDYVAKTVQPVVRVGKGQKRESFWLDLSIDEARFMARQLLEACDAIERNAAETVAGGVEIHIRRVDVTLPARFGGKA